MKGHCQILLLFSICFMLFKANAQTTATGPVRLAVADITHGHVPLILDRKNKTDISIVGVYEPNTELAQRS